MVLFIYIILLNANSSIVTESRQMVAWEQTGVGKRWMAKGHKEIFEMMEIFVIFIVMIVSHFKYASGLFAEYFLYMYSLLYVNKKTKLYHFSPMLMTLQRYPFLSE